MSGVLIEFVEGSLMIVWLVFIVFVTMITTTFCMMKLADFLESKGVL
jgi:hypothetical protein